MWTRRRPRMSATRPIGSINELIVSDWAITTHETARRVTPKSSAIDGRATKTMLIAATFVTKETPIAANARHLCR